MVKLAGLASRIVRTTPGAAVLRLGRFLLLTAKKSREDAVFLTSGALAFVTLLSLIPLLAAFSFVGARVFSQYQEKSLEFFVQVLPYHDLSVVQALQQFLGQAESLHGWGLFAFLFTALAAFGTVEEALNRIWGVPRNRPFRVRLLSFSLLVFWGPVLIGATFSSLLVLRQQPALRVLLEESLLLHLLPFGATLFGLTVLYWLVPYTPVNFRSALAGGITAAISLELLRQGFGAYVGLLRNASVVYGSFTFALFFAISIQLTWAIVLYGSIVSYCSQHFGALVRGLAKLKPFQGRWVGLAAAAALAERFSNGEPVTSHDALADRLRLPPGPLDSVLEPLVEARLLALAEGRGRAYLLARPPHDITLDQILAAYDRASLPAFDPLGGELRARIGDLFGRVNQLRKQGLAGATLADLVEEVEGTVEI